MGGRLYGVWRVILHKTILVSVKTESTKVKRGKPIIFTVIFVLFNFSEVKLNN